MKASKFTLSTVVLVLLSVSAWANDLARQKSDRHCTGSRNSRTQRISQSSGPYR
jgi:hypothetical protein